MVVRIKFCGSSFSQSEVKVGGVSSLLRHPNTSPKKPTHKVKSPYWPRMLLILVKQFTNGMSLTFCNSSLSSSIFFVLVLKKNSEEE